MRVVERVGRPIRTMSISSFVFCMTKTHIKRKSSHYYMSQRHDPGLIIRKLQSANLFVMFFVKTHGLCALFTHIKFNWCYIVML